MTTIAPHERTYRRSGVETPKRRRVWSDAGKFVTQILMTSGQSEKAGARTELDDPASRRIQQLEELLRKAEKDAEQTCYSIGQLAEAERRAEYYAALLEKAKQDRPRSRT